MALIFWTEAVFFIVAARYLHQPGGWLLAMTKRDALVNDRATVYCTRWTTGVLCRLIPPLRRIYHTMVLFVSGLCNPAFLVLSGSLIQQLRNTFLFSETAFAVWQLQIPIVFKRWDCKYHQRNFTFLRFHIRSDRVAVGICSLREHSL
jgi:hypothetical protein